MICEYGCGKEAGHQFKNGKWCCSGNFRDCSGIKEKKKQTCLKKYGVENPFQNKEVQEKMRWTNLKNFGVEYPTQSREVQEKRKQTFMEKYGVENPSQNKEIQEKMKQTCMEKYGVNNPLKNKEVLEKMKQTNIEKYGVKHPSQNKEVIEKMKQTCMKKYGAENPLQNKEVIEKMKQTNLEKYGVEYPFQNKDIQEKIKQISIEKYGAEQYNQSLEAKERLLKKHSFFHQVEEIKIEGHQWKVHCKYSECVNSKEKGGWFIPSTSQINNRINALEGKTGNDGSFFYCSQRCKTNCKTFNVHSDPNRDTESIYAPGDYETFRLHILTRDKYICQFCGAPATDVHHEIAVKLQPFHALDPEYAWSCCEKCHYKKGHKKGTECSTGNLAAKICMPIKKKENFI